MFGVNATPTFFINGKRLQAAPVVEEFDKVLGPLLAPGLRSTLFAGAEWRGRVAEVIRTLILLAALAPLLAACSGSDRADAR